MRYSLLVCAAPGHSAAQTALRTAHAVIAAGHTLHRLFFFRDAVQLAMPGAPGHEQWAQLIVAHQVDALACVTAAERRGIAHDAIASPWQAGGLGQWADALLHSDRVLEFG